MSMTKTIRVFGKEIKNEQNTFVVYSYTKDGEKFYRVKFKKDCGMAPTKRGYWLLTVDVKECNVQKSKPEMYVDSKTGETKTSTPNDILWIGKVLSVAEDVEYTAEVEAKNLEKMADLL